MFRTPYNFLLTSEDMEVNTLPSLAVPDQSLSVREIFERYRTGAPLDIVSRYIDGEETGFEDLSCLDSPDCDLVDVYEEAEQLDAARRARSQKKPAQHKPSPQGDGAPPPGSEAEAGQGPAGQNA